ncbi:MAG: hypothetical protein H0W64_11050 [Gammaproteobacteria bacterium]|nr:hypothetical protein [Gammaproteobacteria bacterium]
MLARASTTALMKLLTRKNLARAIPKQSFHTSGPSRSPCIYESTDETFSRIQSEHAAERKHYSNKVEELASHNRQLEKKLCESRSLLSFLFRNSKQDLPDNKIELIKNHLKEHKSHRIEEQNLLIKRLESKSNQLKDDVEQSKSYINNKESSIKQHENKARYEITESKNRLSNTKNELEQMSDALSSLKKMDVNSNEFLENRELGENISKRFRV